MNISCLGAGRSSYTEHSVHFVCSWTLRCVAWIDYMSVIQLSPLEWDRRIRGTGILQGVSFPLPTHRLDYKEHYTWRRVFGGPHLWTAIPVARTEHLRTFL